MRGGAGKKEVIYGGYLYFAYLLSYALFFATVFSLSVVSFSLLANSLYRRFILYRSYPANSLFGFFYLFYVLITCY